MNQALFIIKYDSYLKTYAPVISELEQRGVKVEVLLFQKKWKKKWIHGTLLDYAKDIDYKIVDYRGIRKSLKKSEYSVVVLGMAASKYLTKISLLVRKKNPAVKLVMAYVGAFLDTNPELFAKGVLRRSVSDLLFVPGDKPLHDIREYGVLDLNKTRLVVGGLPRLDPLFELTEKWREAPREENIILFLEQPTFPKSQKDRVRLTEKLIEIAQSYPDLTVVIKPRFAALVGHAHQPEFLVQEILENYEVPENLEIRYDDIYELFAETRFAITISSTAGIESLLAGIPAYFISDFCGNENRFGSQYFKETGAVTTVDDICRHRLPRIDFSKAGEMVFFNGESTKIFADEIESLA